MNQEQNEHDAGKMDEAYRIGYLIAGFISQSLTEAEMDELDEWVNASEANMELFARLTDEKNIEKGLRERGIYDAEKAVQLLKNSARKTNRRIAGKIRYISYAVAATIILVVGAYSLSNYLSKKDKTLAVTAADIPPGKETATLTLADGRKLSLENNQGKIVETNYLSVSNSEGTLSYTGNGAETEYHTVSTPRGGQYQVTLPDGTAVWLNASSSITYPTAFAAIRKVEVKGEAYFEVSKVPSPLGSGREGAKFIVVADKVTTEVIGTHFNVNAYEDEATIEVTLLEGSVKVYSQIGKERDEVKLTPGQQAMITSLLGGGQVGAPNTKLQTSNLPEPDAVIAWKNGQFEFVDEPIASVMKQISRWYDVTVQYNRVSKEHYNASVPRNVPLSQLIKWLEKAGHTTFKLKDKTIIVNP